MVNKSNYIVCDYTNIILNDGVTLYAGYVEIKDGMLYRYDSKDPNNEIFESGDPKRGWKTGMLHHRVLHKYQAESEPCNNPKLQNKHFLSKIAMNRYLLENP